MSNKVIKYRTGIKRDDKLGSLEYSSQRNVGAFQLGTKHRQQMDNLKLYKSKGCRCWGA